MDERYVVLGLARTHDGWFGAVGRWSAAGSVPVEFVRCVSVDDLRARLEGTRRHSAILCDASISGLDRDLVATARDVDCPVVVVDGSAARAWEDIGVAAVLAPAFSRDELIAVLAATSSMLSTARRVRRTAPAPQPATSGLLVAVTGPGGTGASTCAIALAQGLARVPPVEATPRWSRWPRWRREPSGARRAVLLADLCRVADQAMLHDARTLAPGVQELAEAHRTSTPSPSTVRAQTFEVAERGYRLLLGLRRPRHWTTLRPRSVEAMVESLVRTAQVTVADVDLDAEGEPETGSVDVGDRHAMARAVYARADVVVVVGEPSMKGVHALVRAIGELVEVGVPPGRVLPVVNRSHRSPRARRAVTAAIEELIAPPGDVTAPGCALHLPRRGVEAALRDGTSLPTDLASTLADRVTELADQFGDRAPVAAEAPVPVTPGSLAGLADTG
ncbi:MAG: hypothetical protein WD575_03310 [Nitriliruptoraceae bacterium]